MSTQKVKQKDQLEFEFINIRGDNDFDQVCRNRDEYLNIL